MRDIQRNSRIRGLSPIAPNQLVLEGVCENNLKNLDLQIEHNTFNVITGPSGSGKTSLAFDTIYAEGGRRYIETFSPYTRQFLDRLHQPNIKSCSGIRPALALEQRNRITSSRSTVGTITEVSDYLKTIWAQNSVLYCPNCARQVQKKDATTISKEIANKTGAFVICFSLKNVENPQSIFETLAVAGFSRTIDQENGEINFFNELNHKKNYKEINIVVDRFNKSPSFQRLHSSISQALTFGHGQIKCIDLDNLYSEIYLEGFKCSKCLSSYSDPKPSIFSFNNAIGACPKCTGFGSVLELDPNLVVPNPTKSIEDGAIVCWGSPATKHLERQLFTYCTENNISKNTAWEKLAQLDRERILFGDKKFKGISGWFNKLQKKRHKMHVRVLLSRYRSEFVCPECKGSRLKKDALNYKISNLTISDFCKLSITEALDFLKQQNFNTSPAGQQLLSRLSYLEQIGLAYLNLDRTSKTLSGGESQRVGLTSILGADLSDTTLVLDEPTIGLHSQDTEKLIESLHLLRAKGNTLLVVEHDLELIKQADRVIDIGPGSGGKGGEIVFSGSPDELSKNKLSLTAKALKTNFICKKNSRTAKEFLHLKNVSANNLKNIELALPLNCLCTLVGVSGSGKSSLVRSLLEEYKHELSSKKPGAKLSGYKKLENIVLVDQSPIGKTPRSNAATYTKAWDFIRTLLAETEDAKRLGLSKSSFSFNVDAGRCITCSGAGATKIEMQFLSDVFVECEQCGGSRFQDSVRTVQYRGKNVNDFLEMTLERAIDFFKESAGGKESKAILASLQPLIDLGLGYLTLGQPLSSVSGGEAQRIKLASYLNQGGNTLFVLDEPTTGLHNNDIVTLVTALENLILRGNSILCVEHNLHLIAQSDWIIELGPEGGKAGGYLIAKGTLKELISSKIDTPTIRALKNQITGDSPRIFTNHRGNSQEKRLSPIVAASSIEIVGARQNNLKNLTVKIPKNQINVITGVSGSGKSTLAFDILFAEGQRRYIDCLSPYARQYIKQLSRPEVDRVSNISPTIAVSQKTSPPLGISTIATISEIYQYLRLLYAKLGQQLCPEHLVPVSSYTLDSLVGLLLEKYANRRIFLFAPAIQGRKGVYNELFQRALAAEIQQAKIDGKIINLSTDLRLSPSKLHWISLLVASVNLNPKMADLLKPALEQSLIFGNGSIELVLDKIDNKSQVLSVNRSCPKCDRGFLPLDPQDFSFRSARGVCKTCEGSGVFGHDPCKDCNGARIGEIGRNVLIEDKRIYELHRLKAKELRDFLHKAKFSKALNSVFEPIAKEILARLEMIEKIGLDYLNLDREASSLSGGEAQRLRLAKAIGSPLTGVCYVLDEPSIGLHSADQAVVLSTLRELKAQGNTLVVVEHDQDTILAADHIFDFGPGGGENGGQIVAQGTPEQIVDNAGSPTGIALKRRTKHKIELNALKITGPFLELLRVSTNNLKNIDVKFPLGKLSVVIGVSGSGKSSLVHRTLVPALIKEFEENNKSLKGAENIERYIEVNQTPIGRTSTSTPISYLGVFDEIRKLFAITNEAKARGWKAGHFSFNTGKGKCQNCEGKGYNKIPMSFLPDAITTCEVCSGKRYNEQTLEITYQNLNISEILNLSFAQAASFFTNHTKIKRTIDSVLELGIGYLKLGQPSHTLSGGEAQRIKIANELRMATNTLYVLDEPTVGLHMNDVDKLLQVLKGLCQNNNTVIVIEHNLDLIKAADYLIELGPKAGEEGGYLLFSGTPHELWSSKLKTPTKRFL